MLWKIGLLLAGCVCFAYYALICASLRKWDSTFSRFWLVAGAICMALEVLFYQRPELAEQQILRFLWILFAVFLAVEGMVLGCMTSQYEAGIPYIIVLGAQVDGRRITDSLLRRLERACAYLQDNPGTTVIVSGGQGRGEVIPEAQAMAEYLISRGVGHRRIIQENQSRTTRENFKFSARYIHDMNVTVGIISNNFHMYRACRYAKKLGYKNVRRLPAGCHPLMFLNYLVREFFAVIKSWII